MHSSEKYHHPKTPNPSRARRWLTLGIVCGCICFVAAFTTLNALAEPLAAATQPVPVPVRPTPTPTTSSPTGGDGSESSKGKYFPKVKLEVDVDMEQVITPRTRGILYRVFLVWLCIGAGGCSFIACLAYHMRHQYPAM